MIDAPFFLDAARSVYVIVRLLAMQKSSGEKVFLHYCNRTPGNHSDRSGEIFLKYVIASEARQSSIIHCIVALFC